MKMKMGKEKARRYYDQEAKNYIQMYRAIYELYPANLIRLNLIIKRLKESKTPTLLDVGCATCGPLIRFLREGFDAMGFDFSEKMVEQGRRELKKAGFDPSLIFKADIENSRSLPNKRFDAIIATGVFPHLVNEKKALSNLREMLKKKGRVFIEFRNDLFATFTMNKYSFDFFMNRLIDGESLPIKLRKEVINFYQRHLQLDIRPKQKNGKILFTDILAKFHNPLTIENDLFRPVGFTNLKIHFYHYHAIPPVFENKYPEMFRKLSFKLEGPSDWKGYLMASAYVVEATRND